MKHKTHSKYKTLLFDADETLLDFRSAERNALKITFSAHGIDADNRLLDAFSEVNSALWRRFEKNEIEKSDIMNSRFKNTLSLFSIPYSKDMGLEEDYREALSLGHELMPHAEEVCRTLSEHFDMYIITNGLCTTQTRRLSDSGLMRYFSDFFVSEKIGAQKPEPEYFARVLSEIGARDKSEILVIGDSCSSDINGGIFSGLDTCFFNPRAIPPSSVAPPTYTIADLRELYAILDVGEEG